MTKEIGKLNKLIIPILEEYKVKKASLFGSYSTGKHNNNSDLDILVELKEDSDFFDLLTLKEALEEKLKIEVDLGTYNSLKPSIRTEILSSSIQIL
jgi:uncharacterized protein